jgi:hypothetical protein
MKTSIFETRTSRFEETIPSFDARRAGAECPHSDGQGLLKQELKACVSACSRPIKERAGLMGSGPGRKSGPASSRSPGADLSTASRAIADPKNRISRQDPTSEHAISL